VVTAIVLIVPVALSVGLPTEVALIVDVLEAASAVPFGTLTLTQKFAIPPAMTLAVVVCGVVQVESSMLKVTGNVPPVAVR
jgi:hypothetical protein